MWTVEQITSSGEGATTKRKFEMSMKCTAVDASSCILHVKSWKGRGGAWAAAVSILSTAGTVVDPGRQREHPTPHVGWQRRVGQSDR